MAAAIYLVYGNDEYKVSTRAAALLDHLAPPEKGELARDIIDADVTTGEAATAALARCTEALQTSGLFTQEQVVWLKQASFLGTDPVSKSEAVKERLAAFAGFLKAGLPPGHALLVTSAAVDKRSSFYKTCAALGEVEELSVSEKAYLAEREARAFVKECLDREGLTMPGDALEAFLVRVGTSSREIVNEVVKLAVYVGEAGTATREDVLAVTATSREVLGWDLADAIGDRDLPRALDVAKQLLFQRVHPLMLIGGIQSRIAELMLYREAIDHKWIKRISGGGGRGQAEWQDVPPEVAKSFETEFGKDPRKTHPFRVMLLGTQASKYSMRQLEACRRAALDAHTQLLTRNLDPGGVLELLLVRMLGAP